MGKKVWLLCATWVFLFGPLFEGSGGLVQTSQVGQAGVSLITLYRSGFPDASALLGSEWPLLVVAVLGFLLVFLLVQLGERARGIRG